MLVMKMGIFSATQNDKFIQVKQKTYVDQEAVESQCFYLYFRHGRCLQKNNYVCVKKEKNGIRHEGIVLKMESIC